MEIKDITKEQLETLILLRSLEEFITDEHETYSDLNEAVGAFGEGLVENG